MKKSYLNRIFVFACVLGILVSLLVVPAAAAPDVSVIDYRDYVAGRDIDGSRYLNELSFPVSMNKWYISAPSSGLPTLGRTGVNPMSFNTQYVVDAGDKAIEILYKPTDKTLFSLTNIPKGSSFIVDYSFKITSNYSYSAIINGSVRVYYYDKDRNVIDYQLVSGGSDKYGDPVSDTHVKADTLFYNFAVDLTPPAGSRYMDFRFYLKPSVFYSNIDGNTHYSNTQFSYELLSSSKLYLAINTAYADGEVERENSEKFDEMIDQNNSIINGTPGQNEQVSGDVSQMEGDADRLSGLTQDMQVDKPSADNINVSIDTLVPDGGVFTYTSPILAIWKNDTLLSMLIIVLTLVLVSWVMFGKKG